MFTWICPKCGGEVPPSYDECPRCSGKQPAAGPRPAQPVAPSRAVPPQPQPPPPAQTAAPQPAPAPQPQYTPHPQPLVEPANSWPAAPQQTYILPEQKRGMPAWLVGLLVIVVVGGGLFGLYKFVDGRNGKTVSSTASVQPSQPVGADANPFQRSIEVTGLRLVEEGNRTYLKFVVINHSTAEIPELELHMILTTTNAGPNDAPLTEFDTRVGNIGVNAAKDQQELIKTNKRVYELPDWQFLKVIYQVTSPK